ncbi:MAG: hypothetical protein WBK77_05770 [Alphaproteobacteria bacterium]
MYKKLYEIFTSIALGHAYDKHVLGNDPRSIFNNQNQFRITQPLLGPDLFIESKTDLALLINNHILTALANGVFYKYNNEPQAKFYSTKTNTFIVISPDNGDFGTAYRPTTKSVLWNQQVNMARKMSEPTKIPLINDPNTMHKQLKKFIEDIIFNKKTYKKLDNRIAALKELEPTEFQLCIANLEDIADNKLTRFSYD